MLWTSGVFLCIIINEMLKYSEYFSRIDYEGINLRGEYDGSTNEKRKKENVTGNDL